MISQSSFGCFMNLHGWNHYLILLPFTKCGVFPSPYLPAFGLNIENINQKQICFRTFFMQFHFDWLNFFQNQNLDQSSSVFWRHFHFNSTHSNYLSKTFLEFLQWIFLFQQLFPITKVKFFWLKFTKEETVQ